MRRSPSRTTSGSSVMTRNASSSTPPTTPPRSSASLRAVGWSRSCARTPIMIMLEPLRSWRRPLQRRSCCIPMMVRCGSSPHHVPPDGELRDGDQIEVAGPTLEVMHTPGHTPGSVSLYAKDLATVFTGDTLFNGGPGATGRRFSDGGVLLMSITDRLLALPRQTIVKTDHGDDTTIADERAGLLDADSG